MTTDNELRLPGGLTDSEPSTLTATQLSSRWLDADAPPEWRAPDGSDIYRYCLIDLDYKMGYLLRVYSPESETVDMLAVFVRHGRHPVKGWNLELAWWMQPVDFGDQTGEWIKSAHDWFVGWTFGRAS